MGSSSELITPLDEPAGSHQQVMSPTLGQGARTTEVGAGFAAQSYGSTATLQASQGPAGVEGEGRGSATGGAPEPATSAQVSTATVAGVGPCSPSRTTGLATELGGPQVASVDPVPRSAAAGHSSDGAPGSGGSNRSVGGYVTPELLLPADGSLAQQSMQVLARVGEFFRVARTELVPVQQSPNPSPQQSTPETVRRQLALQDAAEMQHPVGVPEVFSPAPPPGRDEPLLDEALLRRFQALERRAPLLNPVQTAGPPQSRGSSSLEREVVEAVVAEQLAAMNQRAQAAELESQRLRQQLEASLLEREQAVREAVRLQSAHMANPVSAPVPLRFPVLCRWPLPRRRFWMCTKSPRGSHPIPQVRSFRIFSQESQVFCQVVEVRGQRSPLEPRVLSRSRCLAHLPPEGLRLCSVR